ncbi:MAG: hypothetical protein JWM80_5799, partial [Cyanobacteria bacterium RYN_339]|nr:hypothetical protein [Cyanobacteria bacterium RYN_339]
ATGEDRREAVLALALAVTEAHRGSWLERAPGGWSAVRGQGVFSRGIADAVGASGESLAILDLGVEGDWAERASVQALGLQTVWCVAVGPDLLYLDTDALPDGRPERWLPLLEALAAYAAPLI